MVVTGGGFSEHSVILFNSGAEPTTFVPPDKLSTIVEPATASGPGVAPIQVRNGIQTSNPEDFTFTEAELYDPDEHTVSEVEAYVADHPDERDAILAAERAGKNRRTLIAALEGASGGDDTV